MAALDTKPHLRGGGISPLTTTEVPSPQQEVQSASTSQPRDSSGRS